MILTHHGKDSRRLPACIVGGRQYKVVKIGDLIFTAENLDFKYTGLTVGGAGTPSTPNAWYYDNDEAEYGIDGVKKCGLMYNWHAVDEMNTNKTTLMPGWHPANRAEWNYLFAYLGATAGTILKAVDGHSGNGWPSGWGGTDDYGFAVLPGGRYNGSFDYIGTVGRFWCSDEWSSTTGVDIRFTTGSSVSQSTIGKTTGYYVRLVHD